MRAIVGAVAGAIVVFVWSAVFWMLLSNPFGGLKSLEPEQEQAVVSTLRDFMPESGMYYFPGMPTHGKDLPDAEAKTLNDDWMARHEAGPIGMIQYIDQGKPVMEPILFVRGFAINLVSTILVSVLIVLTGARGGRYAQRLAVVVLFGVAATMTTHIIDWNWMYTPTEFTAMLAFDTIIGWTLAGLVMAAIITSPKQKSA